MKIIGKLIFILLGISTIFISFPKQAFGEQPYTRIEGTNRYDTSMKIFQSIEKKSDVVVFATGESYADALCAAPFAKQYNAPILLTDGQSFESIEQIKKAGIHRAFIIGGSGVISEEFGQKLSAEGIECERISGKDRYETAVKIAERIGIRENIVVTTGENFPDALSVAPIAAKMDMPILLVNNSKVPESVQTYIKDKEFKKVFLIGGKKIIDDTVERKFTNVERISGENRFETNISIIERFKETIDFNTVYIATGENFPDALSGSVIVQAENAPLFLISEGLDSERISYIKEKLKLAKKTVILGGKGAVSQKSLYLIGLEKSLPAEAKTATAVTMPDWPKEIAVMNADENTPVYIKASMGENSRSVGYVYGSLAEVKILDVKGEYDQVEALDYGSGSMVQGFIHKSKIKKVKPSEQYTILVDLTKQRVYVFNKEKLIREMKCTSGAENTPTPPGRFLLGDRGNSFIAEGGVLCYYWTRINHNYLFHSILHDLNGNIIESEHKKLGSKASHGCIRLEVEDAKWIYENMPRGTLVTIQS